MDFSEFNVESHRTCQYDAVRVFDGPAFNFDQTRLIDVMCGSSIPEPVVTTDNVMLVVFITDSYKGRLVNTGFAAAVEFIENEVSGKLACS